MIISISYMRRRERLHTLVGLCKLCRRIVFEINVLDETRRS